MNRVLIITNHIKDKELVFCKKVEECLAASGAQYRVHIYEQGNFLPPAKENMEWAEATIVLGGDGTILRAAMDLNAVKKPILGVNLGNVGYLSEIEIGEIGSAIEDLLADRLIKEERMMICGSANGSSYDALNEVTITRNGRMQVMAFEVSVNGRYLTKFMADGILVATPTGSTAYNLSAGGPIVEPSASLMVLNPICSHSLKCAPIVLSPEDVIEIKIEHGREQADSAMEAVFDGKQSIALKSGDVVRITRSCHSVTLLKTGRESFLTTLQKKLTMPE